MYYFPWIDGEYCHNHGWATIRLRKLVYFVDTTCSISHGRMENIVCMNGFYSFGVNLRSNKTTIVAHEPGYGKFLQIF